MKHGSTELIIDTLLSARSEKPGMPTDLLVNDVMTLCNLSREILFSNSTQHQQPFQIEEVKPINLSCKAYFDKHIIELGGPMCIDTHRAIIFVADKDHEAALQCKFLDAQCTTNYSFPTKTLSALNLLPKKIRKELKEVLFWRGQ